MTPEQTKEKKGICPVCSRPLTIGVMYRVTELADRSEEEAKKIAPLFYKLIPLQEIIADCIHKGVETDAVQNYYTTLVEAFGNELLVLQEVPEADLAKAAIPLIAEGIIKVRQGKVNIKPGYDGVFGEIKIFENEEKNEQANDSEKKKIPQIKQQSLF